MSERGSTPVSPVARQEATDALCEHFAQDHLTLEEFERRIDRVQRSTTLEELRALLSDLPDAGVPLPTLLGSGSTGGGKMAARTSPTAPQVPRRWEIGESSSERRYVVGVLCETVRQGRWAASREVMAIAVLGGATVDLREAEIPAEGVRVHASAILGGVEVIVPPDLRVECEGVGICGAFEHGRDPEHLESSEAPVVRVTGVALLGGVEVVTRLPGESAREARRRRKRARKRLKRSRRS